MLKDTRFAYHFCILLLPFAIVHFLVRFCKKWWFLLLQPSCWLRHAFFLHTLVSYCAMHDTNLWRPLTIAIFGSFDQACILTAHTLFSSFLPYIWLYHLASGDTVQVPCLSENSPSFTCHILSLICTNLSGTTQTWEMHTWHLFDLFACSMSS